VVVLEPIFIDRATDEELAGAIDWLKRHNIVIDVDVQAIARNKNEACGGMEGYAYPEEIHRTAEKLSKLNAPVAYIHIDEPLWFGAYATDANACRLDTKALVSRVAQNLEEFLNYYPDVKIVHVEPIPGVVSHPGWRTDDSSFEEALKKVIGKKPVSLQLDIDWGNPGWRDAFLQISDFVRQTGEHLGIIYNGTGADDSDSAWIDHATRNYIAVEDEIGIIPDQAVFASWNDFPTHLLPETAPLTETGLILAYKRDRTTIVIDRISESAIEGHLADSRGANIPGAEVTLERLGLDLSEPLPIHRTKGRVPHEARSALLGIRLNTECNCKGQNDIALRYLRYDEDDREHKQTIILSSSMFSSKADTIQVYKQQAVHILLSSDQSLLYNSATFPVSPDATFDLSIEGGSLNGDGIYGNIVAIWLDEAGHGITRTFLIDEGEVSIAGTAKTDEMGRFSIKYKFLKSTEHHLKMTFQGTTDHRGTAKVIK
jgi:hypothetical protein